MRLSMSDLATEITELEMLVKLDEAWTQRSSCINCGARISHQYQGRERTLHWLEDNGIEHWSSTFGHRILYCGEWNRRLLREKRAEYADRVRRIRFSREYG